MFPWLAVRTIDQKGDPGAVIRESRSFALFDWRGAIAFRTRTGREIAAWTTISQLLPDVGVSGGGFRRTDITEIDDIRAKEIPILAEATSLTFSYHWDSALAWLSTVEAASRAGSVTPFRITIGTTKIYGAGYWGYNSVPSIQNGVLVSSIELSLVSDVTTYTT